MFLHNMVYSCRKNKSWKHQFKMKWILLCPKKTKKEQVEDEKILSQVMDFIYIKKKRRKTIIILANLISFSPNNKKLKG